MRAWTSPHPQKKGLSLLQTVFVHGYCHRSQGIRINYVAQLSAFQPPHQLKASHGGFLPFKEKTFFNSENIFRKNNIWCLFLIWWHLTVLRWTDVTMDILWPLILTMFLLGLMPILPCICNCIMGFVSSHLKAFQLQMVVQAPMSATTSSNYYLGPLHQRTSIWGLGEYIASTI